MPKYKSQETTVLISKVKKGNIRNIIAILISYSLFLGQSSNTLLSFPSAVYIPGVAWEHCLLACAISHVAGLPISDEQPAQV